MLHKYLNQTVKHNVMCHNVKTKSIRIIIIPNPGRRMKRKRIITNNNIIIEKIQMAIRYGENFYNCITKTAHYYSDGLGP